MWSRQSIVDTTVNWANRSANSAVECAGLFPPPPKMLADVGMNCAVCGGDAGVFSSARIKVHVTGAGHTCNQVCGHVFSDCYEFGEIDRRGERVGRSRMVTHAAMRRSRVCHESRPCDPPVACPYATAVSCMRGRQSGVGGQAPHPRAAAMWAST